MRHFALLVCFAGAAFGQQTAFGVVGGGSLTDAFQTENVPTGSATLPFDRFYSSSRDWMVGGAVEFRLPLDLSIEVNGLYRKLHLTTAGVEPNGSLNGVSPSPVITWEFPVLAKYRFRASDLNPFIEVGPSFRTVGNLNGTNPSHYGIAAGIGVEMRLRGFNISPVLRYTRWAADGIAASQPTTNPDQIELLVEVSHASEIDAHPFGQHFSIGLIGGITLRNDLSSSTGSTVVGIPTSGGGTTLQSGTTAYSGRKDFLVGPTFEFALPKRLYLEIDALYHPLRYNGETTLNGAPIRSSTFNEAITWDFPVLAKYKIPLRPLRPFLEAGPSFRLPQNMNGLSTAGIALGAGVEAHFRALRVAPAFRYTHWASDGTGVTQNQIEILGALFF